MPNLHPRILHDIRSLVASIDAIDIRPWEGVAVDVIRVELVPMALEMLERGTVLARDVLDAEIEGKSSGPSASDLAFVMLAELRNKRERLSHAEQTIDGWELLSECGSSMRRVRKSLAAIENLLAGADSKLRVDSSLQVSIATRRLYRRLRRIIDARPKDTSAEVRSWFRAVGTRMAMIIGDKIYPDLRVSDRVELRRLQVRVIQWLGNEDALEGQRLAQDLQGFSHLISHVRRREELVLNDAEIVRLLLAKAAATEDPAATFALTELSPLVGLDDQLDELMEHVEYAGAPLAVAAVRPVLERLESELPKSGPPSSSGGRTRTLRPSSSGWELV